MVLVAFEMIEEDMAKYLAEMDIYDREIMVLDHKIRRIFNIMGDDNEMPIL